MRRRFDPLRYLSNGLGLRGGLSSGIVRIIAHGCDLSHRSIHPVVVRGGGIDAVIVRGRSIDAVIVRGGGIDAVIVRGRGIDAVIVRGRGVHTVVVRFWIIVVPVIFVHQRGASGQRRHRSGDLAVRDENGAAPNQGET